MKLIKDLGTRPQGKNKIYMRRFGLYECPMCKKHFEVNVNSVKTGNTKGCNSCSKLKLIKTIKISDMKEYHILNDIKQRCYNKKSKAFPYYGGRGITVCDQWKNDYKNFISWANKNGYKENLTIDRINVNGNYEPSNCRWVPMSVQAQNTRLLRSNNASGFRGVSYDKSRKKWFSTITYNKKTVRIGKFNTALEAGYAYDKYVIDNELNHNINGLYEKELTNV